MNNSLRDGQAPSHRQCLLPPVAGTPSVAKVTPAKKITFLKQGDPQFAGVRLAVHQRTFKTFSALMDELSQRMPLSFGVRSVTTPRGLHGLSALDQLQDGGCYLCSDKKIPKVPSGPGWPPGGRPSTLQTRGFEGGREAPGTPSSLKDTTTPRRIRLVKNGDPRTQQTMVLSHKNTRNLTAFLSRASDLLHFPVKQVYTVSGKKVDCLQALLHSPSVLVCTGNEAFRPLAMEEAERNRTRTLSGLTSRNKSGCWGPKAKQSVIHSRSRSSGKPQQFSLLSERSGLSDHPESGHCAWVGPAPDGQPQDTSAPTGTLVAGDNMEKKVHMNEDGSLSVEMKVRFQLLGEDALLWSQRVGCAGILTATSGGPPVLGEANPLCCRKEGHSWGFSEPGTGGLGPLDAGYQGVSDRDWWPGPSYEIWRNPLCSTQGEGPASQRRSGPVRCMAHWRQGPKGRKRHGKDSVSPALRTGSPEGSEPDACGPRTPEGGVAINSPCSASMAAFQSWASQEAGQSPCPGGAGPGGWGHCSYLGSGTWGIEKVLSDSSANVRSHEQSCKLGSQPLSCLSQARAVTSQGKAIQCDSSCAPALSPSSLSNEDLQGEKCGQGAGCHQARDGPLTRLLFGLGHSGSWDTEGGSAPPPLCAPSQQGRKKQQRPASAMSPPNLPNLPRVTQNDHARQCHYCRDTHCPLDSTAAPQTPRPPDRGRACPGGPVPRFSQNSPSNRKQDSQDLRLPSPSSFDSRDLPVASRVITQISHSDSSPRFYHPSTRSVEPVGDSEEGEPGAHQGCYCAYRTEFPALSIPSGQTQIPQGRLSEDCWVCSSHCPTPPADPSCAKKPPVSGRSSFSGHQKAVDGARPGKVLLGMYPDARGDLEEQEEDSDVMPTALPHSSPDTVVREWLGNIPEEPVLMTYEMVAETTNVLSDGQEGSKDFSYNHFLNSLGKPAQTRCQPLEGDTDEHPEIAGALLGTADAEPKSETGSQQDAEPGEVSIAPAEVGAGKRVTGGCGGNLHALPGRVSTSTQLMKALMGCKPGRPSSLPEVSSAVATRLSHSAGALITCLARLHFSEEDLGSLGDKAGLQHSPRYQELLNISQTLWPGCSLRQGQLDLGLRALTPHQALPVTEGFTPTSSSGVDVSSGSGGSGEQGSVPCVMDSILVPKKMELPLKISSSQRPNSRTSGHSEDVEPPQPSCSPASSSSQAWACATSREEAERGSRKQPSGSNLEQLVENTMQEEKKQLEETERERPQEGVEEEDPPEGAEVSGQEVPGAGSEDGEGSWEDKGVSEEEAGKAPASAGPCSLGRTERPAEDPGHLSRRLSESPSGPSLEPGLEEPRAAVIGHEQAQAKSSPGSEEKNASMACRTPLDPDSTWVSKLLKKMEKAFMGHLARAMAELRARWSLQDNSLLDQMVAELEQDVGQRLQGSTEKELRKIQSWVGRRVLGPPRGGLQGQTSLQTEQRRHRLRTLHNLSAFPEQTRGLGSLSLTLEDWSTLGTALETRLDGEAMGDEFCPCKACVRKKVTLLSPKDTTGTVRAPIRKAFDLQQILQQKKGECTDGEAVEMVPKKKGTQEDPLRAGTVQRVNGGLELGLSPGPRVGEEGKEEDGSQRPSGDKAPEFREVEGTEYQEREEDAATHKGERKTHTCVASTLEEVRQVEEEGETEKEGTLRQGSGGGNTLQAAGQGDGADTQEAREVGGEGQPESEEGNQSGKESGFQVSPGEGQRGQASENSSLDQEGRHMLSPAPGGGTPHQMLSSQTLHTSRCLSSTSSLGNYSQVCQKGSGGHLNGDLDCRGARADGATQAERKITAMYPETSSSEQEEGPRTPEKGMGGSCDLGDERAAGSFDHTQARGRAQGFGQDDLDF